MERRETGRQTGPSVNDSNVYGREEDVDTIVGMLLSSSSGPEVAVIPIVGIGGMGKTTLAQLVYNHPRVTSHFQSLMWVSVNGKFNPAEIIKQVLSYVREGSHNLSQIGLLQSQLRESLLGKRYLIVLDDVWNEDPDEWDKVMNPLKGSVGESKIVLTTRSEAVAAITSTFPPFHLEPLSKEECWKLFKHRAFADGTEDGFPSLLHIGEQIVDKCKGVPLVANILGSLLRLKREESEWLHVLRSELWSIDAGENRILSVLRLSYNHLPSHLKACFAYCSVFPKNYVINKEKLIHQWLAHGLIPYIGDPSVRPEDIGNEYFKILLMMCFFQEIQKYDDRGMPEFKMHDHINDLAKSVAGEESLTLGQENVHRSLSKTCHASVVCSSSSALILEALCKAKRLRTLNFLSPREDYVEAIPTILATFKHLRMLNFSGSGIKRLDREIGGLLSLRYLDLSNTLLETLPATICDLCNLQTLNLSSCSELKELPSGTTKLINLRHLNIDDCPRLASMPPSMSILRQLQTLPVYIVGRKVETSIAQLVSMTNLRGKLKLKCLEEAKHPGDFVMIREWMKTKDFYSLELLWQNDDEGKLDHNRSRQAGRQVDDKTDFTLVDSLTVSPFIKMLSINGYSGTKFPDEMSWSRNLTELNIINCRRCESLPPLGQLPVLKILNIQGMYNVVRIGVEFFGQSDRPFASLKELSLIDFPELTTWDNMNSTEAFTCLGKVTIRNCPSLKAMPGLPCVQYLELKKCHELVMRSASEFKSLSTLVIDFFQELSFIPKKLLQNNSCLMSLTVTSCPVLRYIPEDLEYLTALKSLKIGWCNDLDTLPGGLKNLTSLENLEIIECPNLICLPEEGFSGLCSLRSFSIENCPRLTCLPMGMKHLAALESLTIICLNLVHLPDSFESLSALRSLTIFGCPELTSLPEGLQYSQNLQILEIRSCSKLMEFPEWVEHIVSLRSLAISDCPDIKLLPKGLQCLRALQHLSIRDCPNLEKRCERGTGEDWHKISHIPYVYVGSSALQQRQDIASTSQNP
ncbi:putative disease resistance protein RGA3 [Rosa sericea]